MMTKEEKIDKLIAAGAKRWTKGDMDRLYINAEVLGLDCKYYSDGSVNEAFWGDEKISKSRARALKDEKHFVDIADMSVHTNTKFWFVRDALSSFIAAALA